MTVMGWCDDELDRDQSGRLGCQELRITVILALVDYAIANIAVTVGVRRPGENLRVERAGIRL